MNRSAALARARDLYAARNLYGADEKTEMLAEIQRLVSYYGFTTDEIGGDFPDDADETPEPPLDAVWYEWEPQTP